MKDELSPRSRQMLGEAIAGERELVPDAERRRRLKRAVLQGAVASSAGSATVAKAAAGKAAAGAVESTVWLTVAKSALVGFVAAGGVLGAAHSMRTPAASTPATAPSLAASAPAAAVARSEPVTSSAPARSEAPAESEAATAPRAFASSRTPPRPPSADGSLRAELALITAAQAALRDGKAASALAALERYDLEFPAGQLGRERLAAEVFAACQIGDRARASRAAARFLERDDQSALARRVKQACVFTDGSAP